MVVKSAGRGDHVPPDSWPYVLAFSFGAIPAWIAGGVAGSISMVRAANAGVGEFSKLPKFTPAIVGGAVAGPLPVIILLIIHLS